MTRKTKIGLAVAGSFLTLVGGVIGVKQFGHQSPAEAPETKAVAQNSATPRPDPFNAVAESPATNLGSYSTISRPELPDPPLPNINIPPAPVVIPAASTSDPIKTAGQPSDPLKTRSATSQADSKEPFKLELPALDPVSEEPVQSGAHQRSSEPTIQLPGLDPTDTKGTAKEDPFAKPKKAQGNSRKKDELPSLEMSPLNDSKESASSPGSPKLDLPKHDATSQAETPVKIEIPPVEPITPAKPMKNDGPEAKNITISIGPKKGDDTKKDENTKKDETDKNTEPPNIGIPKLDATPSDSARDNPKREGAVRVGPIKSEETAPKNEGPTQPLSPPPTIRQDGGYDEDLHRTTGNETYPSISRRYYEDDTYAAALQQYNRDNPAGSGYIRIPPIEVLMKRYPNAAPKGSSRSSSTGVATASLNVPAERDSGDKLAASPVRDYPVYTVADNGETLRDIAQKTLGNAEYWRTIYELNISVNPNEKLAGGTRLRLPPQARVQN
jgi:nucleoid-associated protein YgaU